MNKELSSFLLEPHWSFIWIITAPRLGYIARLEALDKINLDPNLVDEVLWVTSAGTGQAPARQAAIYAGLPNTVACTTINKVCASGMKAVMMGAKQFKLRCRNCYRCGMENMSLIPHYMDEKRNQIWTFYYGRWITKDGLVDAYDTINGSLWIMHREYEFSRRSR
jgi:acetyl-CoA C-acetyltransferase